MTPADRIEKRLADLEELTRELKDATFGTAWGQDGLVAQLKGLRQDFGAWRREDTERREEEQHRRVTAARAVLLAMASCCVGLLSIIVSLIGVVVK